MTIAPVVAAALLKGLGWFLVVVGSLLAVVTAIKLGGGMGADARIVDVTGAAICAAIGLICLALSRRFAAERL